MSERVINKALLLGELEPKAANERLIQAFPSLSIRSDITPERHVVYFLSHCTDSEAAVGKPDFILTATLDELEEYFQSIFDAIPLKTFRAIYRKIFPECYLNTLQNSCQSIFTQKVLNSDKFREFVLAFDLPKRSVKDLIMSISLSNEI